MRRLPQKHARPRVHDGGSARDVAANAASSGITLGVVLAILPKVAALLSVLISGAQLVTMVRRYWRKWHKGCPRRRKRLARLFGKKHRRRRSNPRTLP